MQKKECLQEGWLRLYSWICSIVTFLEYWVKRNILLPRNGRCCALYLASQHPDLCLQLLPLCNGRGPDDLLVKQVQLSSSQPLHAGLLRPTPVEEGNESEKIWQVMHAWVLLPCGLTSGEALHADLQFWEVLQYPAPLYSLLCDKNNALHFS